MAYGQKSRGGSGNSGLWVGYRSIKNGVVEGRVTKKPSTRGGTKSSSKRPRAASRKPYTPVEYPSNKSAYFNSAQSWEDRESQLIEGIKNIQFLADFDISE